MLISFSGAQSSGKSTLLKLCQDIIPEWNYIPEITRLVKRDYDLPINENGNDLTQMMIASEHLRNAYTKRDSPTILDRCSLDGLVYTHWLCDHGDVSLAAYTHARWVFDNTIDKYDLIIYTQPEDVPVEDDGERSINVEFRNQIIDLFEKYMVNIPQTKLLRVTGPINKRMTFLMNKFETMNLNTMVNRDLKI
jgi:nicotinamide riboside kinase